MSHLWTRLSPYAVTFDEFVRYYNSLQSFLKTKLTKDNLHSHVLFKFR